MRVPRSSVVLPLAVLAGLFGVSTAQAAIPWAPCAPAGFQCASVAAPLDRSGAVPGSINLGVTRKPAAVGASKTAIVALAGGPGQAALPFASDFASIFGTAALANSDLLVFDQRGTGTSGQLSCAAFKRTSGSFDRAVQDCSLELGAQRAFYTTAQSVEDIEQLRIDGGYDKLVLYGVSYGTKVAEAYAAAHPATTQSLVLDSVVTPEGPDALRRSTLAAVPRVIGQTLCGNNACAAAGGDPVGDLTRLSAKLAGGSLKGTAHSSSGKAFKVSVSINDLISTLVAGDLNPALRSELPGAVHAALSGDKSPLVRLAVASEGLTNDGQALVRAARRPASLAAASDAQPPTATAASAISEAILYYATICEETTSFPWTRGASTTQRASEATAATKTFPAGTFGLFGTSSSVALGGLPSTCLAWVVGSPAPAAPAPLPDVPVLVLDGEADLRTPLEDAQNVASRFPRAQVISVPDTGHSVVTAESGTCAKTAVVTFLAGGVAAACPAVADQFAPSATPPTSLKQVTKVKGLPAKVGETLNAVVLSFNDGRRQIIGAALATGNLPKAIGGLRSGSVKVVSSRKLRFLSYEFVPGVEISGYLKSSGTSTFTVSGTKAARGTVKFLASGAASGRLGGKKFSVQPRAAAARVANGGGEPTLAEAVATGKRRVGR